MKVIGKGHAGVVLEEKPGLVRKLYQSEKQQQSERINLEYVASLKKQGFDINCRIPAWHYADNNQLFNVEGKQYQYSSILDFIPGNEAIKGLSSGRGKAIGRSLGLVLRTMHTSGQRHKAGFIDSFGIKDEMWRHIFEDKAAEVIDECPKARTKDIVQTVMQYLQKYKQSLESERTLSHLDLNLRNIIVDEEGTVTGLIDWSDFGLTHPSLVMYQLASMPNLWLYIKQVYEALGGVIREDILYAAATIHVAWAPIRCAKIGIESMDNDIENKLDVMYEKFNKLSQ